MTIFGIGGCMALLLLGFGIKDSISAISEKQYGEIITYDFSITHKDGISETKKEDLIQYAKKQEHMTDYFTFPHNDHYPGNVKDHCYYERDLKFGMRAFLQTEEAAQIKEHVAAYDSVEELTSYIRSIHNSYMKLAHTVEEDIRYIVHACTTVVKSVMNMVSYAVSTSVMNIQYV